MQFGKLSNQVKFPTIREREIENRMKSILETSIREGTVILFLPGVVTISLYMVLMVIGLSCLLFSYSFAIYSFFYVDNSQYGLGPILISGGIGIVSAIFSSTCMLFIMQGKIRYLKVLRKYTLTILKLQIAGALVILGLPSEMPLCVFAIGIVTILLCYRMICSTRVYMLASFFLAKQELREQYAADIK